MDLLNPPPLKPPNPWPKRILYVAVIVGVIGGALYFQFRYYSATKTVEAFMDALVAGDYKSAYKIWQPAPSYAYHNFLRDWGETSTWGKIRTYEIVEVHGSGNRAVQFPDEFTGRTRTIDISGSYSGVLIGVRINTRAELEYIWVEKKDLSLSFPPF